jgi:hypothetical protein
LAAAILLLAIGYFAVPIISISYMVFFGPPLACGNNCSDSAWLGKDIAIGSIAA